MTGVPSKHDVFRFVRLRWGEEDFNTSANITDSDLEGTDLDFELRLGSEAGSRFNPSANTSGTRPFVVLLNIVAVTGSSVMRRSKLMLTCWMRRAESALMPIISMVQRRSTIVSSMTTGFLRM